MEDEWRRRHYQDGNVLPASLMLFEGGRALKKKKNETKATKLTVHAPQESEGRREEGEKSFTGLT